MTVEQQITLSNKYLVQLKLKIMKASSNSNVHRMKTKWILKILLLFFISISMSCGGAKNSTEQENYEQLSNMVNNQRFEIENQWANPMRGGMVNLLGNPNYLIFSKDSVDVYLPYFGERQMGGGYGNREGGIVFKGVPEEVNIIENREEKNITLRFRGQQGNEDLRFIVVLYPDGGANTSVNSSQRDAISYRGEFRVLQEKEKHQADVLLNRKN